MVHSANGRSKFGLMEWLTAAVMVCGIAANGAYFVWFVSANQSQMQARMQAIDSRVEDWYEVPRVNASRLASIEQEGKKRGEEIARLNAQMENVRELLRDIRDDLRAGAGP